MTPKAADGASAEGGISPKVSGIPAKLAIVLALTAVFTLVEIGGGILSNSLTLMADASHMGTDVAALALALIGSRIAQRRDGAANRFSNLRWEVLAAMVNGLALFIIGAWITVEAVGRFDHPRVIDATLFGTVASVGLIVNLISLRVLHGHHEHNLNARGAYLHILGDVLGSVGAIVAAIAVHYTGWTRIDPIVSVLVSVLILRSAWRLVRESAFILLDRVPERISPAEVEQRLLAVSGVTRVHDMHVWTVTSGLVALSVHVVVPDLAAHHDVRVRLEHEMARLGIGHVTIQLETDDDCEAAGCGEDEVAFAGIHAGHDHSHHGHSH
ncbi:MAG TPA: cation diffusion facilitator family transporter [Gemmatimonadales bacterium]|jgi:cobalt-zinc-cadmium efflux system protein|nr:cation diffusion facilitator family transporter [Gemmatimonadales bacterium]